MPSRKLLNALKIYNIFMESPYADVKDKLAGILSNRHNWLSYVISDEFGGTNTPSEWYPVKRENGNYFHEAFKKEFGDNYQLSSPFSGEEEASPKALMIGHRNSFSETFFGTRSENISNQNLDLAELCRRLPMVITETPQYPFVKDLFKESFKGSYGVAGKQGFAIYLDKKDFEEPWNKYLEEIQDDSPSSQVKKHLEGKGIASDSVIVISEPLILKVLAGIINFPGASYYLSKEQKR